MPMKNTYMYPLNKNEKACSICNQSSFSSHFSGHLRSGHYNVVWTSPYNMIVHARASIAERLPPSDAFLANEKACYICDLH